MTQFDSSQTIQDAFRRLRRSGFELGVSELLAALKLVDDGFEGVENPAVLKGILNVLWCSSFVEQSKLEAIWDTVLVFTETEDKVDPVINEYDDYSFDDLPKPLEPPPSTKPESNVPEPAPTQIGLGTLPLKAPFVPLELNEPHLGFNAYSPVSRRDMVYMWRYLRRPLANGPLDVLDVPATVAQYARQGFYLSPVYRRRLINHAHLMLFVDQGGSMMPFHRITRELVETAVHASDITRTDVYYFQNVPGEYVYTDSKRTQAISLNHALASCYNDTSVMIISDAGAARGYRNRERNRQTTRFLNTIKRHTSLVAWLNPMPKKRWLGSSAQIIARKTQMFQLDRTNFDYAIDMVRGQIVMEQSHDD